RYCSLPLCFFFMLRLPPISSLFPYTTLFRSVDLYCADLKRSEFYLFKGIAKTVDVEPLKLHNTLLQIRKELVRRGNMLDKAELRSEEHTSELQSRENLVCRLLLEKKKQRTTH